MNLLDWIAHPTRYRLRTGVTRTVRRPEAFELFGRRWHVGLVMQAAGAPVIDGCSTVNFDEDPDSILVLPPGTRRYGGVCIRLRPTVGRGLVIARRDRPALSRRRPRILFAPRPDGWIPPRPFKPYRSLDDFTYGDTFDSFRRWEAEHQDTIND